MFADEMVVANVQLIKRLAQTCFNFWMAMSKVEDATIAVTVDEAFLLVDIPKIDSFTFSGNKV